MINFKWIKLFLVFLLSFVLQTTVGDWLQIFGVGRDGLLLGIPCRVYAGYLRPR